MKKAVRISAVTRLQQRTATARSPSAERCTSRVRSLVHRWRTVQDETANTYVIEIAVQIAIDLSTLHPPRALSAPIWSSARDRCKLPQTSAVEVGRSRRPVPTVARLWR